MAARVGADRLDLHEVHRFPNRPVRVGGTLHWDVLALYGGILEGLRAAGRDAGRLAGVGIDSWGVDTGWLDADGALLGNPVHYRDGRHETAVPAVHGVVPPDELYRTTGLQHLPFNTIFQLAAARGTAQLEAARTLLLIPDLLGYWLTGAVGAPPLAAPAPARLLPPGGGGRGPPHPPPPRPPRRAGRGGGGGAGRPAGPAAGVVPAAARTGRRGRRAHRRGAAGDRPDRPGA